MPIVITDAAKQDLTNSPYTTNRILEIPQDIKLELNNGTLTLKAGSKVYVPNGFKEDGTTPKFDVVTVPSDVVFHTGTIGTNTYHVMLVCNLTGGFGFRAGIESYESGSTAPSDTTRIWYDTTNNAIKAYKGGSWVRKYSLPIGIYYRENGNAVSIDQVFNGFGYIGSTVFLLPGVKTVVPDGRNENGTCKNKAPSTVSSVKTETISRADTAYMFTNHASSVIAIHHYICSKTKPTVTATTLWYNPETNLPSQVLSDGTVMTPYWEIPLAKFTSDSTGKITSFEPFTVDSVVNSNEFYQLKDKAVTTDTVQTITATKKISIGETNGYDRSFEIMMPTSTESNPTENKTREIAFISSEGAGERYEGSLTHYRLTTGESYTGLRAGRLVNGTYKEGTLGVRITADGTSFGLAPNTPANASGNVIVTADYVQNKYVDLNKAQTISGSKRFTRPPADMSIELIADTNQQTVPTTTTLRQIGLYRNATYSKGDGYTGWVQGYRGSDGNTESSLYTRRFLEGDSQEIINYIKVNILPDGTPISYTKTPPANSSGEEIVTAGWLRQSGSVVRTVIETYRNGANWYRIWSDGWIEQGGVAAFTGAGQSVSLMKKMSDANYTLNFAGKAYEDTSPAFGYVNKTTTAFTVKYYLRVTAQVYLDWSACGY